MEDPRFSDIDPLQEIFVSAPSELVNRFGSAAKISRGYCGSF